MLIRKPDRTISFTIFSNFPEVLCVMSTRKLSNSSAQDRLPEDNMPLVSLFKLSPQQLVSMDQIHATNIVTVSPSAGGKTFPATDGLITHTPQLYLSVTTADCVPLFFFNPINKVVAIAHVGWRGTLGKLAKRIVQKLNESGSDAKHTLVAIGPHIGGCCYVVDYERAKMFKREYTDTNAVYSSTGSWHIDLGFINKTQLIAVGIRPEHIDAPITCTSCQNDLFFSFRKDGREVLGKMQGIIGMRD